MYRTIIVGCDGSEATADAVALAQQLRDPNEGRIILVNVFPLHRSFVDPFVSLEFISWLQKRADEVLDAAVTHLAKDVPFDCAGVASASAAFGLSEYAEDNDADLIVLGRSHRGAVGRSTARTTVQRLLHDAPCAVAVAGADQANRLGAGAQVCVAYDNSPESRLALATAYDVARRRGANVKLCAALERAANAWGFGGWAPDVAALDDKRGEHADRALKEAAALAPGGVEVETEAVWGDPAPVLLGQAAGADLLVAGSRGYGTLHRAIAGSVSGALLTNGSVPVLVTPRAAVVPAAVA